MLMFVSFYKRSDKPFPNYKKKSHLEHLVMFFVPELVNWSEKQMLLFVMIEI